MHDDHARTYWKSNVRILTALLTIWFLISFGGGILFADFLDQFRIGGFKLGFWMAQQGSIYGFVVLIIVYVVWMDRLDARYNSRKKSNPPPGIDASSSKDGQE